MKCPPRTSDVLNHGSTTACDGKDEALVGEIRPGHRGGAEVPPKPRFARELSCCWQDARNPRQPARRVQRNALDRKLSCCWQDREPSASHPGLVVVGGYARRGQDCSPCGAATTRDSPCAIYGAPIVDLPVSRVTGDLPTAAIGPPSRSQSGPLQTD